MELVSFLPPSSLCSDLIKSVILWVLYHVPYLFFCNFKSSLLISISCSPCHPSPLPPVFSKWPYVNRSQGQGKQEGQRGFNGERMNAGCFSISPVYLASPFPKLLAFYLDYKPVGWSNVAGPLCLPDKDPWALFQDSDYCLHTSDSQVGIARSAHWPALICFQNPTLQLPPQHFHWSLNLCLFSHELGPLPE